MAQQFGQWSWDGIFGAGQRAYQNSLDDNKIGSFDQRDLKFSLGINGFIVHPAVARFRFSLDGSLSDYQSEDLVDTNRWGFGGDLRLFSRGKYRVRLFAARRLYDYSNLTTEDPITLRGMPETSTTLGGRLRITQGRLTGILVGLERTSFDLLEPEADNEVQERDFVDWARAGEKFQRHFRLERRFHSYGAVDFDTENITANFDQLGDISDSWRWHLFGSAMRQSLSSGTSPDSQFDTYRLRNQLFHFVRGDDRIDLEYSGGWFQTARQTSFQSHRVSAAYRWRPASRWEIAPFVSYGMRLSEITLSSPEAGVSTSWSGQARSVDFLLTNVASLALVQLTLGDNSRTDTQLGLSLNGAIGHGHESRLRTELEGSWSRNQLRLGEEAIIGLPEFILPLIGVGSENLMRGRLTLRRRWGSFLFSGYSELSRRESSANPAAGGFSVEGLTNTVQVETSRLTFLANLGNTRIWAPESQHVRFRSASLLFRPWFYLNLKASYRTDTRELILAPDVDGERAEIGVDLRIGAFNIDIRAFETTERRLSVAERTNRGVIWTLTRRFQGWLPFVTRGPGRGGVM